MAKQKYSADFKYAVVRAAKRGKTLDEINTSLASSVSKDSLRRWNDLYERTRAVVCDPSTYLTRGRPFELEAEDLVFITSMVTDKPTVYLDEIQRALIEEKGVSVSLKTIAKALHKRLKMSKKSIRTVNPRQDAEARAYYLSRIGCFPTSYLVFTGESIFYLCLMQNDPL
jgi:transposase